MVGTYIVTQADMLVGDINNTGTVYSNETPLIEDNVSTPVIGYGVVAGTIYQDSNNNGIQDPGEPGIANVTVTIMDVNGTEYNLTTNTNGAYALNVLAGSTTITIDETTLPSGISTQTQGTNPTVINVPIAGTASDIDGYTPSSSTGTVKGIVYEDTNGNGIQDTNETGIAGVTVTIRDFNGDEQNVTTDSNGEYTATALAGEIIITIDETSIPGGSTQTQGTNPTVLTLPTSGSVSDIDGYEPLATSGVAEGVVYEDTDGSGIQDPGEPGIPGVTIQIVDSLGNMQTVVTDINGSYSVVVPDGNTTIDIDESTLPGGSIRTEGTDPTILLVPIGGTVSDVDGFQPSATSGTISGIVYDDENGNGIQDANETGLAGVNVTITDSNGRIITLITDSNGTYSLTVPSGATIVDIDQSDIDASYVQTEGTDPTTINVPVGGVASDIDGFQRQFTNVFDPPSAIKTANAGGWPEVEWKMVWINDGNALAMNVHVEDPLSAELTFIDGTLSCDARGTSTTDANATGCYYDAAQHKVIWNGNIAADFGNSTEDTAANEVVIIFRTTVPASIDSVENQGIAYWDQNGDGNVDYNDTVVTDDPAISNDDDPTAVSNPTPTPTPTPTPNADTRCSYIIRTGWCYY